MQQTMMFQSESRERAEKLEAAKKFGEAAVLWERMREVDRAVEAYRRSGKGERAALVLEREGRKAEAASLYASVGQHSRSAALYEAAHAFAQAAKAYLNAGQREQAALMCERDGDALNGAKIYASLGNYAKATQLYDLAGAAEQAAQLREQHGLAAQQAEESQPAPGVSAQNVLEQAASGCLSEQEVVAAVIAMLRGGRAEEAVRLYSACQQDIGYPIIAAVAGQGPLEALTAQMFYAARDYHKAAQVLESLEEFDKAGALYEHCNDYCMAAEMFVKAGNGLRAAEMYERHGSFQQAAELFLESGANDRAAPNFERCMDCFRAGKLFGALGRRDKALQLLQKVPPGDHDYLEACHLVGQFLAEGGYVDLAIKRYADVVRSRPIGPDSAPIYHHLGVLLEHSGRIPQARQVYERILSWSFDYEDADARLQRLNAHGQPTPQADPLEAQLPPGAGAEETTPALVTVMDGFEFLRDSALFCELTLDEVRRLYDISEQRTLQPGQVLIEQNSEGQALYIIRAGQVVVSKLQAGTHMVLAKLGPGSPVGEMSLIDDAPTSARVTAEVPSQAFEIPKERFRSLLQGDDHLALKMYRVFTRTLAQRLRKSAAGKSGRG